MSAARARLLSVRPYPLQCEPLEARITPDGASATILPGGDAALSLHDTAVVAVEQPAPTPRGETLPSDGATSTPPSTWQVATPFPILVTALLVTLCGQVELFGGRAKRDSWSTPLL